MQPYIDCALLNTDGGSRGNPGPSGIGFTIGVDSGRGVEAICRGGWFIGTVTNNVAEYQALIWGLQNALDLGVRALDVRADSELVVKQLRGEYKVKNEGIKPLFAQARQLLTGFERYTLKHVMREGNAAADELANQAMDTRAPVGDYRIPFTANDLFAPPLAVPAPAAPAPTEPTPVPAVPAPTEPAPAPAAPSPTTKGTSPTMYTLTIKDHFDAAHALVGYPGECKNLHGHTWDIEVSVKGTQLDEVGILYDFKDLKANLKSILDAYDHKYLNDVPPFDTINATAENLARIIYDTLEILLPPGIDLAEVSVWESPIAKLTYTRDQG